MWANPKNVSSLERDFLSNSSGHPGHLPLFGVVEELALTGVLGAVVLGDAVVADVTDELSLPVPVLRSPSHKTAVAKVGGRFLPYVHICVV
jgi:hypothetical protein